MVKQVLLLQLLVAVGVDCLTFTLNPEADALFSVSEKFLSVALDSSNIEDRFADFNFSDPYLVKLVNHLSPMHFRVGGTYADRIVFSDDTNNSNSAVALALDAITFLASDYLKLYRFTQNANVRLLYDLNSLLRNGNGSWNSENAKKIIEFSNQHQMDLDWELGNEPDLYSSIYSTSVNASQLASDYKILRSILDQYERYKTSYLMGNDMFNVGGSQSNKDYLGNFLKGASSVIHAVTFHHYYFAGRDATEEMFLSPSTFNYLEQRINDVTEIVRNSGSGNKVWLGETSSAYNGGAANMSNRFIGTFLWLDKLGLGAKLGLDVIIRQTFFHDVYALIDDDYVPNPDWWLSVLYKKLVGTKVLSLSNDGSTDNTIRLYAHCGKACGSVVVFGFNVANETASVNLEGFQADQDILVYELTYESSLYSQFVRLNGEVLSVSEDGEIPELKAKILQKNEVCSLSPYSIVFWVYSNTNVTACQ